MINDGCPCIKPLVITTSQNYKCTSRCSCNIFKHRKFNLLQLYLIRTNIIYCTLVACNIHDKYDQIIIYKKVNIPSITN